MQDGTGHGRIDVARTLRARAEESLRSAEQATGEARAVLLREAARSFFAAGDVSRGHVARRAAFDAWPADDTAFLEALRDAASDVDRLQSVLTARARAVPAEAAACARARADALLAFGRAQEAVTAYRECLVDSPTDPGVLAGLAEAHAELGEGEESLRVARRLVEVSEGHDARRAALDTAAKLASRFADRGRDAADLLESAAGVHLRTAGPASTTHVLVERAVQALVRAGENARAGALMALAAKVAEGPVRSQWLARLAETALARGDEAAARAARAEALRAHPSDHTLRRLHLAEIEGAGDSAALVAALEDALEAPGADVATLSLRLGRAHTVAGDEGRAAHAFARVCALEPGTRGWDAAVRGVAMYLDSIGDTETRDRLEVARTGSPNDPATTAAALLVASSLYERGGDRGGARRATERARDLDPRSAEAWRILARLELAAGDRAAAARALLEAAARSSGATGAAAALEAARLFDAAGLGGESAAALRAAVEAGPGSPVARRILAQKAREAGDLGGAARHLAFVDTSGLPGEERASHDRALARALSEAGDPSAPAAWRALFDHDESDPEAFDRVSEVLRARGEVEQWLTLAARHDRALAAGPDRTRRCDLRCDRAALVTDLGDLDSAERAWRSALEVDPRSRRAMRGLRALLEHRGDPAGAADQVAAEAAIVDDPEEAAELFIDEARISLDELHDRDRAARAVARAVERLKYVPPRRGRRLLALAGRMGIDVDLSGSGETAAPPPEEAPSADSPAVQADDEATTEDERLRALAAAATGPDRAACLHRLSVRLERRGDAAGALDAAMSALEADPAALERFDRAVTLARADPRKAIAAHRLRVRGARTPAARAQGLVELGTLLAASPESLPEAVEVLERAHALHPASGAATAALARALLAIGEPERAVALLSRFENDAPDLEPAEAVRLLIEAARAAGDPGLAVDMAQRTADRSPRDPAVLSQYACALAAAGREREAIVVEERAIALQPPGAERLDRRVALAARAEAVGDHTRALWLYQGVRTARPEDVGVLTGLARIYAASSDAFQLASVARDLQRLGATAALGSLAAPAARAILRGGDAATALPLLRDAHRFAPHDLSILRELAAAAERAGAWSEALSAGAAVADAEAERHPSTAASRLLRLAEIAGTSLGDPQLAVHLRERAATLSPFDPAAPADAGEEGGLTTTGAEESPPSVEQALERLREAPFDAVAAGQLAGLARLLGTGKEGPHTRRLAAVARTAGALAAFATGTAPRNGSSPRPIAVGAQLQEAIAHPLARTTVARLFALLAPFLEPLFPADLAQRGVAAGDRLGPSRAPELLAMFEDARRALDGRPCLPFLREDRLLDVAIENTTPPSVVLSSGLAGAIPVPDRRFLLARAVALVDAGWALAGKFAPRDVAIMCELGCRLGGFTPPAPLLPEHRARPFLQALAQIPERVRLDAAWLGAAAVKELPALSPTQLVEALRQNAARIALLHVGDPYAALVATVSSDARLATKVRSEAVNHPDLRDLALVALSEGFLAARADAEAAA